MAYCKICGKLNCKEHSFLLGRAVKITEFSGSSPPEVFVGRYNYPHINIGILSPQNYGDTGVLSSPRIWKKYNLDKNAIVSLRNQLIYGRTQGHIKMSKMGGDWRKRGRFLSTMQETAMTHKSISTEFKLKKAVGAHNEKDSRTGLITNAAQVEKVRLQENPKIKPKVEYLVGDTDVKSVDSMLELEKSGLDSYHIVKILSAGLLGLKTRRKLVPTRWSITAVDDALSKDKLKKIRYYPEISEILLFHSEYLGNHYEFLLLPDRFSFEVIEIALRGGQVWRDYEGFFNRKKYAHDVTGAYYANRLAVCEYLEKIGRQACCLVLREIRPEYNIPLGVGILREASRSAFSSLPEKFESVNSALNKINERLKGPVENYSRNSQLLKEYGKQRRLGEWF